MDKVILTHSLTTEDNSNVLVVGACRTGKTQFFVKPNLLSIKDSVIVISKNSDRLFENTVDYRKEKFKQNIFTNQDFTKNKKNLNFLGDDYTVYLTASAIHKWERLVLLQCDFNWIINCLSVNPPKKPVSIIIDDLFSFPVCAYYFMPKIDNVRIIAVVQLINDIAKIYKKPEDMLDLFKIKMFFETHDPFDAQYVVYKYGKKILPEEILQLKYNECIIFGLKDRPIYASDKIQHWFSYGKVGY